MIQIQNAFQGKKYWRSLDELANTQEFRDFVHREFPEGAPEMLEATSRRTLLKLMGASFGLAGLAACRRPVEHILPNSKGIENYIPGKAYFYSTAYAHGGYASGLLVETHDGRPTKIEGNPEHPFSLGAASAFSQGSILDLYDPDRSYMVTRDGKASDWKEFTAAVGQQLNPAKVGDGAQLRFLSERITSPSLASLKADALQKYPKAKWVEYDPIFNENLLIASQAAFGQTLEPQYHFDKADVVVSLDHDFLGLDSSTILPVKQYSKKRRVAGEEDQMNRLYVVESQYSITGANADHRTRMRSADIPGFAQAILGQVGGLTGITPGGTSTRWLQAMVKDLQANKGKCLVLAGPRQDVATQIAAFLINEALGNVGETVTYVETRHKPALEDLGLLAKEMANGQVSSLVILGGNPVYSAPVDLQFEANLKKVPFSIHLGSHENETTAVSKWHIPQAHYLESWSDAMAPDGTASVQQPMIEPLHGGKTSSELVAMLLQNKEQTDYGIVRKYWNLTEPKWRQALHDGVIDAPKSPEAKAVVNRTAVAQYLKTTAPVSGIEVVFTPSYSVYDGRYANNGWLQETPDPITKLVWANAAMMSAGTAKNAGVVDGDIISIEVGGLKAEIPAMVQPGHAEDSITIPLGYGRKKGGRVGTGVGFNAYPLRGTAAFQIAVGAKISKTGRTERLSTTQNHHSMEGRPIVREATLPEYRKNAKVIEEKSEVPELFSLYDEVVYDKGYQWGMAIDLNACIGCNACMVACQSENNIPIVGKDQVLRGRDMHWIRLDRYYTGDINDPQVVTQPMTCQQCENAPCENVCPVAATVHSDEGLNMMTYNRCVGTRYCGNNCPYKVRRFNFLNWHKNEAEVHKMVFNPDVTVRMRGIMEKCTYCVQRIQEKKIEAKVDGRRKLRDGEIVTACQQTCPADAIVFGDILDPESRVMKLKKQERNYVVLQELNTRPRTTYLAKLRNPNPELGA